MKPHMYVSPALKKRVEDRIQECTKRLNIDLGRVNVLYDINSKRLGGQAIYSTNTIRLNPVFLNAHTEQYIFDTVAHELCHLAALKKYGRLISAHGAEWKSTMRQIGVPPARCHQYKVPEGIQVGKHVAKYKLVCSHCDTLIEVGAKVFGKVQAGSTYRHKPCGGKIVVAVPFAAPKVALVARDSVGGATKLDMCTELFLQHRGKYDRQQMLNAFVQIANCTNAGASTYYAKLKKLHC